MQLIQGSFHPHMDEALHLELLFATGRTNGLLGLLHLRRRLGVNLVDDDIERLVQVLANHSDGARIERTTIHIDHPKEGITLVDDLHRALLILLILRAKPRGI